MARHGDELRWAGEALAELVWQANRWGLPLVVEPTRVVRGVIVHPTQRRP